MCQLRSLRPRTPGASSPPSVSLLLVVLILQGVSLHVRPALAQRVTGTVRRADNGAALPGANVALRSGTTDRIRYGTSTGPTGAFTLSEVAPGTYRLEASFLGYADAVRHVEVATGDTLALSLVLRPEALPQQEVVVTAGRAERALDPVTAGNLTTREIRAHSGLKDMAGLLADLPSTTFYSQNGNGIGYSVLRMRGFDQRRIAVSVNGVPQNDPENFNVYWINLFDLKGAVRDVQVQRGAAASYYGSTAIGGAVNVVAEPYRPEPYARAHLGAGSYGTRRLTVEANTGRFAGRYVAYGRFSRVRSDGYRDWSWSRYSRYFVGIARYGSASTLSVQSFGGPQRDGLAFLGIPKAANDDPEARRENPSAADDPVPYFTERGPVESFLPVHLTVHHRWAPESGRTLDQRFFWIKGEGYFDLGVNYRSPRFLRLPRGMDGLEQGDYGRPLFLALPEADVRQRAYLDQHQVGWIPELTFEHADGRTTIGLEARLHRSRRWGRIQEANPVVPDSLVGGDRRIYAFRGEKLVASAFGRRRQRFSDRWLLRAGAKVALRRYRFYDERFFGHRFSVPYVFVQPRVGVTLFPDRPWSAYGSVALARREPQLDYLYDADAAGAAARPRFRRRDDGSLDYSEPLVRPESLLDVELGTRLRGDRHRLAANVYWMEFRDEIVPSGGVDQFGNPRVGNAERTRHLGLELQGAVRPLPGWDVSAHATLSRNRLVDYAEYVAVEGRTRRVDRSGNPIAGFPARMGRLETSYRFRGLGARLELTYAGRQYVGHAGGAAPDGTSASERVVEPYLLATGSLSYQPSGTGPWSGLEVRLRAHNVLDRRVLRYGYLSDAGPRFFPAAPRHFSLSCRYTLR